jgi:hypothetical protein
MRARRRGPLLALLLAAGAVLPAASGAQQIVIDRPVHAGDLTVYPDVADSNAWYYVNNQPRLAIGEDGKPRFAFLRWVENVRTGADQAEAREGEGGGIVTAVVQLKVLPEQVQDAQGELRQAYPQAVIRGQAPWKSGRLALISAFKDSTGGLSRHVLGLGAAPLLDGDQAAVSILLTKLGAKVLWESFQTATPDVSFSFEMDLGGFESPCRAKLWVNLDEVYKHSGLDVNAKVTKYLGGEVRYIVDDLMRKGAIRLVEVGNNEQLDKMVQAAYGKAVDILFTPLTIPPPPPAPAKTAVAGPGRTGGAGGGSGDSGVLDALAKRAIKGIDAYLASQPAGGERDTSRAGKAGGAPAKAGAAPPPAAGPGAAGAKAPGTGQVADAEAGGAKVGGGTTSPGAAGAAGKPAPKGPAKPDSTRAKGGPGKDSTAVKGKGDDAPWLSVYAVYEVRKQHRSGQLTIDLERYLPAERHLRFDHNVGDLRGLTSDPAHFHQSNLDDPLYRQREIVVFLDGMDAQDFGRYVNFATVHMRKRHAAGEVTDDEVRIDRNNFNRSGNAFKLLYGWKGDVDRSRWLDYEYQTTWSFFGGQEVAEEWRGASAGAIAVTPPFQHRTVEVQAEKAALDSAKVRAVTVRVYARFGTREETLETTLNPASGKLADRLEILVTPDRPEYEYEITWQLRGGRTITSGRRTSASGLLFADELPPG